MTRLILLFSLLFICGNVVGQNFTTRWNTNLPGSANTEINIPTNPAFTYNYSVDWGDGNNDTNVIGDIGHTYAAPGIYVVEISGDFPSIYFNNAGDREKIIEILDWGTIIWQSMENSFYGCENLNFDAIQAPNLSQVTSLKNTFRECTAFNGILNNWDVSTITDISGLFQECEIFNRPLDNWNTSGITDMSYTFHRARDFNEPLDNWNVSSVDNFEYFLSEASDFNQNINNWDISSATNLIGTFRYTGRFNQPLNNWNIENITDLTGTFQGSAYNQPLDNWNVSNVVSMQATFRESQFNQPLNTWNVSNVTNMAQMFHRNRTFDQPLNNWNVSNVIDMSEMFDGWIWGAVFNQPLDNWDVSNVEDMEYMFRENAAFNQDISGWDVSNVRNMRGMFEDSPAFNQNINNWNVGSVTNMSSMFQETDVFNQPLNNWNMSAVTDVTSMFYRAAAFNQPLDNWDMTGKSSLANMFRQATAFNQDISGWNTIGVTIMSSTFASATSFDQNLGLWNISNVGNMNGMLSNSGLSQENYDNTLIGWESQTVQFNVNLGATNLQYCDALNQRQRLIDDFGWNITGDAVNCSFVLCTEITMPAAGDTMTPANSDIRWNPAPNADGYRITLEIERGGARNYAVLNGDVLNDFDVGNVIGLSFTNEFLPGDIVYVTVVPYNAEGPAAGCPEISFTVVESWVNSPDAFKLTYDTSLLENGSTPANQLKIEANTGFPDYLTYNYSIDWGDGQYDNNVTGQIIHTYLNPGIYTVSIIGDFPAPYHWVSNSDHIKLISIDQWGSQVWQSMQYGFYGCENMVYNATDVPNLTQVENTSNMFSQCYLFNGNIDNWDVSNVTNMLSMFISARIFNQPLNSWNVGQVTNMYGMFGAATEFNQPLDNWDVSQVTNMNFMFAQTQDFNQDLSSWNTSSVNNMGRMFQSSKAFDQPINNWNVGQVTDMSEMFQRAEAFNQPLNNWNTANVQDMSAMFYDAELFNQNINSWNVSSVTDMTQMFYSAPVFNQPLDNWNVSSVTTMNSMFSRAEAFNQNIDSWNVTNVTDMSNMFSFAEVFNEPLNSWEVNSVVNMSSMFRGASAFNQPLENWDVSAVANMSNMFDGTTVFNQPLNTWDVSSVTLMPSMFEAAEAFDQPLNNWDTAVVTNFDSMLKEAIVFNQPLNNWDTGEGQNMASMFYGASAFNQNIAGWNTSFVTTMEEMFREASSFNQSLDAWNVASVNTMQGMFQEATSFNGSINNWNVRAVTTMLDMFNGASSFNQPLNDWRVNGVADMERMFRNASSFNQPLNLWLVGSVSMREMFHDAIAFNQFLGDWNIENVSNMQNMLDDTALTRENYDNTLIAWSEQNLQSGINLGANTLPYCDAVEERQSMITNFGWVFTGDVLDCPVPDCTQLVAPLSGAVEVPVNTNLNWNAVTFAREYRLIVGTTPGGNDIVDNEVVVNDTFYEFAADFAPGVTVYVTMIPSNENGDALGPCIEESFTITATPATVPDCTNLSLPLDGDTDISVDTDISWDIINNADGYRINVGTTPGGTEIINNEDVGNTVTYDFATDLPEDALIYITINPYNEEGTAIGCTEESFRTEFIPVPPICTTLTNPLNGATAVPIDTDISWNAVPDATGYLITIGTTQGGIEIANNIDVGNFTTYDIPTDLQEDRTHYVTIIPYNAVGDALACSEESFRTGNTTLNDPPLCTTLANPLNGTIDVTISTDLSWNPASNTEGYFLTVATTFDGNDILDNFDVGNVTIYDLPTDLPENTEIFVTITPYNSFGSAATCSIESFTTEILATIPNCTTLSNPLANSLNIPVTSDLTWNTIADADGYLLTVGTTAGGNDILDAEDVTGNTFDLPTDLPESTQIFVTIIPYNGVGNATGCVEESFTTETVATIPSCTSLSLPLNAATDVSISTDLTWNTIANADGYLLTVGTTAGGNDILDAEDVTGNTFDLPTDLPENTQIFVTIVPYNGIGNATGCAEESFTTETIATVPVCTNLISPLNAATDVSISTDLTWNTIANADGYLLTVGTTAGGNDILDAEDVTGNTFDLPTDLPENTQIFVTIVPYNGIGNVTGCAEESFTTETVATIPSCTSLSLPLNAATDVSISTDLTWNTIANADGYLLTVGTTAGGIDILDAEDVTGNTFDLPTDLPENTQIFVTIVPYNGIGNATGCIEESFTTETIATVPVCTNLTNPLNATTDVSISTDLTWNTIANADGYLLTVGTTAGANDILDAEDVTGNTFDLPTDLPENTQIFVTIVPYNGIGNAIGCAEESFTTETVATIPSCTSLSLPLNAATDVSISTDLTWNALTNADGYFLSVRDGASSAYNILDNLDVGNLTTFDLPADLPANTDIYVLIIPYNGQGNAIGCAEEFFVTGEIPETIPECTVVIDPLNMAIDVPIDSEISWSSIENATGYRITIGTAPGLGDIVNNEDVGNITVFEFSENLPENAEIFVLIIPYNTIGDALSCDVESFITGSAPLVLPECTMLTFPENGAEDVTIETDISWTLVENATGYILSIGTSMGAGDIIENLDVGQSNTYDITEDLPYEQQIFINIIPYNDDGFTVGCQEQSFTTEVQEELESQFGFSPDGDGINDFWTINGIEQYPTNVVMIFNRWGDMVFKTEGYDNNSNVFTGNANQMTGMGAGQLPEGTYFFRLVLPEEHNLKTTQGFLVLKR
ncbi:BspA family leucine-rich repeat surface protein [Croceivirga thetidis]|uniref:BspA family leucine-rich repeat surface protein n=1 Tax=Croceivirga thetidis TaxID=2721623 RepID=A0ABX1GRG4_9FLAO|nr:BspA family leucine-rich repeat surface protein [Croceivirga thetidis]NKI31645.1 BspA family leucine-rich repeat surface protein [Croceivirga thetidis]